MPKHVQVIDGEKFSSHAFYRKQTQRGNVTTYIPQSILTNPSTFHRPWISWNPEHPAPVPRRRVWRYQRAGARRPRCPSWRIPGFFEVNGNIPMIPMCIYVINKHRNKWIHINIQLQTIINIVTCVYIYIYVMCIYIYIYTHYIYYIYITDIIYSHIIYTVHMYVLYIYIYKTIKS